MEAGTDVSDEVDCSYADCECQRYRTLEGRTYCHGCRSLHVGACPYGADVTRARLGGVPLGP